MSEHAFVEDQNYPIFCAVPGCGLHRDMPVHNQPETGMDAAAVPVPDAGDDTLRDQVARAVDEHRLTTPVQCTCKWRETDSDDDVWAEHVADALLPLIREHVAAALRDAAQRWRPFVADGRCPTCQMATRETKGMVCQTCGTDYMAALDGEVIDR